MHNPHDQLVKNLARDSLSRVSTAEIEVEVLAAAQKIDVYTVPDPARSADRAEMGLLGELTADPTMLEPYHKTPGLRLVRHCLRKQLTWHHELERRARVAKRAATGALPEGEQADEETTSAGAAVRAGVPFPALVILSPGRPETALESLEFRRVQPGVYRNAPGFAMSVVVLAELPRTRATLMLRLWGAGQVLRDALADLDALPAGAWEKSVATPLLLNYNLVTIKDEPANEENDVNQEIQAWYENYQRNEQRQRAAARDEGLREGRHEGERKLLLRQLRARFGELPAAVTTRVDAAEEADLERWGERVLAADTLAAVFGDPG